MRRLERSKAPDLWLENEARWQEQWNSLRQTNPSATFSWYRVGGVAANHIALPVLLQMSAHHCSFCESFPVEVTSPETIEHFRPKSGFPELAYSWGNLFMACTACQGTKGDEWSDLLLKPDEVSYRFDVFFTYDFESGEMMPNQFLDVALQARAQETIKMYGLNECGRPRHRVKILRDWKRAQKDLSEIDDEPYRSYIEASLGCR